MHIDVRRELARDPWFVTGMGLALLLGLLVLLGPMLAPHDPHDMSFRPLSPPSAVHWLGVNDGGMDIFSELLYGIRNTVGFGLLTGIVALFFGVAVGLAAAWFGGLLDQIMMRLADILLAIPAGFDPGNHVVAHYCQSHPVTGSRREKPPSYTGVKTDGGLGLLYYREALGARTLPSLSDWLCYQGPHGHVHGGFSGLPGIVRSEPKILGAHDWLCAQILLPSHLVELDHTASFSSHPVDHDRHLLGSQPGEGI